MRKITALRHSANVFVGLLFILLMSCASPIQIATTAIQAQHSLIISADKTVAHWYTTESNKCYDQAINVRDSVKPINKDCLAKAKESYDKCIAKPNEIALKINAIVELLYSENKIAAQLVLDVLNKKSPIELLGNISKKSVDMIVELQSLLVLYKIGGE